MPHKDPAARREQRRKKYAEDAAYRERLQASNRTWAAENRDAVRAIGRRSHVKHKEARNAASRAYTKAHAETPRRARRAALGIIDATGEARTGVCPVCEASGPLVCDHDHNTGLTRGWLCRGCNLGLGQIGDTLAAAQRLVRYLESTA